MASTLVQFLDGVGHEPHDYQINGNYTKLLTDVRDPVQGGTGQATYSPPGLLTARATWRTALRATSSGVSGHQFSIVDGIVAPIRPGFSGFASSTGLVESYSAFGLAGATQTIFMSSLVGGAGVDGGTMLTAGRVRLEQYGVLGNGTGGPLVATFGVKFGTTLMATLPVTVPSTAIDLYVRLTGYIFGHGATNAQAAYLQLDAWRTSAPTITRTAAIGTAAIDSTVPLTDAALTIALAGASLQFGIGFTTARIDLFNIFSQDV